MRLMVQGLRGEDAREVSCNAQLLQAVGISSEANWMESVDLTLPPGASILTLSPAKNNRQQAGVDRDPFDIVFAGHGDFHQSGTRLPGHLDIAQLVLGFFHVVLHGLGLFHEPCQLSFIEHGNSFF